MSIIEGLPQSEDEWREAMNFAGPLIEQIEAAMEMTPPQKKNLQQVKAGVPLSVLWGITKEEREAALAQGCRLVAQRKFKAARAILLPLFMLHPYDARVPYTAAVSLQLEGDVSAAAKLLVQAIALDATNPEGYLRLGECFLTAKEYENAADAFESANDLCERNYGSPKTAHYARKMLDHVLARMDELAA
jgi:tetratricopeptide (TPR) repeat protein